MADEPVVEEVVVEPEVVAETPHPLEEGGVRFNEVYARMKAAEDREREKDARLARLEGIAQAHQAPPTGPAIYTPQQLQAAVDQGLITPMVAADVLSRQNARVEATATAMQVEHIRASAGKLQAAGAAVNQYLAHVPALKDVNSADFAKVRDAAYSASDDMNLPVTDLRVQRRALREVYGTLDKMAKNDGERESSRRASLPHTETSAGGTRQPAAAATGADAWKKDVPADYLTYWKQRGYSEQQMKDEAKYVTKAPRKVQRA